MQPTAYKMQDLGTDSWWTGSRKDRKAISLALSSNIQTPPVCNFVLDQRSSSLLSKSFHKLLVNVFVKGSSLCVNQWEVWRAMTIILSLMCRVLFMKLDILLQDLYSSFLEHKDMYVVEIVFFIQSFLWYHFYYSIILPFYFYLFLILSLLPRLMVF